MGLNLSFVIVLYLNCWIHGGLYRHLPSVFNLIMGPNPITNWLILPIFWSARVLVQKRQDIAHVLPGQPSWDPPSISTYPNPLMYCYLLPQILSSCPLISPGNLNWTPNSMSNQEKLQFTSQNAPRITSSHFDFKLELINWGSGTSCLFLRAAAPALVAVQPSWVQV
jgi:hypothetical protein